MYPIKNWLSAQRGYRHGEKTTYSKHHLGIDIIIPIGTEIYAPFDGKIEKVINGEQGGLQIHYRPFGQDIIIRFLHLSFVMKEGSSFLEGAVIGKSGNSGKQTTGAHLHLDISKHSLQLNDLNNFIDPEQFDWQDKETKLSKISKEYQGKILFNVDGKGEFALVKDDTLLIADKTRLAELIALSLAVPVNKEIWDKFNKKQF